MTKTDQSVSFAPVNENYRKKKQPQAVRAQIMAAATQITIERGLGGLTLDLAAQRAGVSKGGLIHHYPNRHALVTGLFYNHLMELERSIEKLIAQDDHSRGRFTRAFVKVAAYPNAPQKNKLLGSFALAMSNAPELTQLWRDWFKAQLKKYGEDTGSVVGQVVRYAADGIWLENCTGSNLNSPEERQAVMEHLISLTYAM